MSVQQPQVISLNIHPIKSCGGIQVSSFEVGARGPLLDREWMITDEATGLFITQRESAKLALLETALESGSLPSQPSSHLVIRIPSSSGKKTSLRIALDHAALATTIGQTRTVQVWKDTCLAHDQGDEVANHLSQYLGRNVRLMRMASDFERHLPEKYGHPESHTGFADQFPFLLCSEESLADLNSRLIQPIPMNRFRANIVISGAGPYEEDTWKTIRIGDVLLDVTKYCSRCVIINTDQSTGERQTEPLKTLAGYRRDENGKVLFGQNLTHLARGHIKVGDTVEILERR